jgi:hypothetical protein
MVTKQIPHVECLLCDKYCLGSVYTLPHNNTVRYLLLSPFVKLFSKGSGILGSLFMATQLFNDRDSYHLTVAISIPGMVLTFT